MSRRLTHDGGSATREGRCEVVFLGDTTELLRRPLYVPRESAAEGRVADAQALDEAAAEEKVRRENPTCTVVKVVTR